MIAELDTLRKAYFCAVNPPICFNDVVYSILAVKVCALLSYGPKASAKLTKQISSKLSKNLKRTEKPE